MEVDEEQFNNLEKRLGRVNRNLETGGDEYEDDDTGEESDTSLESGQESTRRRAAVKRATENRKERQEWEKFKHAQNESSAKGSGAKGSGSKGSGARGSNDPAPRTKRTVQDLEGPTSPETIRKAARINWKNLKPRMRKHTAS